MFLKKYKLEIILISPMIIFVVGFTFLPILQTIILGFQSPASGKFTLDVYKELFLRQSFVQSIWNTIVITIIGLIIQIGLGFFLATILKKNFIGKGIVRALVFMPMGVPTIVAGVSMLYIFMTSGYLNELLFNLNIISKPLNWTSSTFLSLIQVGIADSWKVMPIVVLFFLSGLESIPQDIYEAADIDGASRWDVLFNITIPQLKPTITMVVMLRAVDLLRIFELPMVLLGKVVPFIGTFSYEEFYYGNTNASAAASTILLGIIILFVAIYLFLFNREGGVTNENRKA